MIVTVGVNPRDKRNENYFGGILEIISKIVLSKTKSRQTGTKHIIMKIRDIYVCCLREIDTE